jgi:hypothetical protein
MSNLQEVKRVLLTATVTMVLVVVPLWPLCVNATDQNVVLRVLRPTMMVNGCQFTMETPQPVGGEAKPTVTLKAVNTGKTTADASVWVVVSASKSVSPMARVMPPPHTLGTYERSVHLVSGDNQTLTIPIDVALPAGESISITMTDRPPVPTIAQQAAPAQLTR